MFAHTNFNGFFQPKHYAVHFAHFSPATIL